MRDPPGPGLKLVSPALAGGLLTTAPPGKSPDPVFNSFGYVLRSGIDGLLKSDFYFI